MKKLLCTLSVLVISAVFISWGYIGHHVIGEIADRHLTPEAQKAVRNLLGHESLASVSSWADEVSGTDRQTESWHYVNVPTGLSFGEFKQQVAYAKTPNVYNSILRCIVRLCDKNAAESVRVDALRFLVHFVGDIHQPMHVSRAEDRGGNKIIVSYYGEGTNLHAVWDTKLIEQDGISYKKLADKIDHPTPVEIKKWQSDPIIMWAWESYQLSTILYKDAESPGGANMGKEYYNTYIPVVEKRLEKAGIRLAGLLNAIFSSKPPEAAEQPGPPVVTSPPGSIAYPPVKLNEVSKHIGETANVRGAIAGYKDLGNMLLLDLGAPYPGNPLTVVLKEDTKAIWDKLKQKGSEIIVMGKITDHEGKPEIEITDAKHIVLVKQ